MARKRSDEKAESAASESNHTGQLEEQEKRNKNQRRGFNKQNRQAEKRLAAAAQAATPLPQTTMLQEAHLLISDGTSLICSHCLVVTRLITLVA